MDVPAGNFCKTKVIDKAARWLFQCFDMTDDELDDYIQKNSQNNFLYVEYSYKELGRDDAWLEEMVRDCHGNLAKIKREILLEWPKSMENSVFNEEQLDRISQFVKEESSIIRVNNYPVSFYETPDLAINYIISCDVGGGLGHDSSAMNIIHPEDFRIVGDFVSNKIDTESFKRLIRELMTTWLPNSLLVVERNSYGLNILDSLMKEPKIEPRMFRFPRESLGEKTQKDGFTVKRKTNNIIYGVDTNTATRKQMMDLLPEIVDTEYDKLCSPNIYKNISCLERKKTGKIEHADGQHDDSLMAYLIFRWAVFHKQWFSQKGISAIPTRSNVKTVSSSHDMRKIERLLMQMQKLDTNVEAGINMTPSFKPSENKEKSNNAMAIEKFFRMLGD